MKTRILFLGLLIAMVSCSDKVVEETFHDKLVGTWRLIHVEAMGSDMTSQASQYMPCVLESTLELKNDGSYEYIMPCTSSESTTGKYFVSDPQILLQAEDRTLTFTHVDGVITTIIDRKSVV